jgi:AmmeMemoRadiSam system protein A
MTSPAERELLLRIAREAIAAHVGGFVAPVPEVSGVLARKGGAFVTLKIRGALRGCIGHVDAEEPLGRVIPRCAVAACSGDPRFDPVTAAELPRLALEISLLEPLEAIAQAAEVEVGRHGLVVERGLRRGLLLPQVATDWGWDRETFLAETCHKAGLPRDAWKHGATLWRFEADVFGEP